MNSENKVYLVDFGCRLVFTIRDNVFNILLDALMYITAAQYMGGINKGERIFHE